MFLSRCLQVAFLVAPLDATYAYCLEPSFFSTVPEPPGQYLKPSIPYCLTEYSYSGRHTCDSWEIDSYMGDVEEYIRRLQLYADEAVAFANSAHNFAVEAGEYAQCEAEDAASQHE